MNQFLSVTPFFLLGLTLSDTAFADVPGAQQCAYPSLASCEASCSSAGYQMEAWDGCDNCDCFLPPLEAPINYEGSTVPVEWGQQHGCAPGSASIDCNMVVQTMCDQTITGSCEEPPADPAPAPTYNPCGATSDNRNGLECPEERDYYPYGPPTPWEPVAPTDNAGEVSGSLITWIIETMILQAPATTTPPPSTTPEIGSDYNPRRSPNNGEGGPPDRAN